ncbi:MAG TPA: NUDIX hydrolase [Candidatus Solibacter sp.]|nr:NUDIX hydrolase [Candidatus Solibacter sp.]
MKPLKTEVAFATPWFEILAKTMQPDEAPYYSLRLPDYSAIVAITDDQRIVAVRQYRPAVERYTIELPSGLVDPGESPAEAASRELMEETGYQAGGVEVLGPMEPDTGRLGNLIWSCVATGVRRVPGRDPEDGIEVLTYSPSELARATASGEFRHALHVAILMMAVLRGKLKLE